MLMIYGNFPHTHVTAPGLNTHTLRSVLRTYMTHTCICARAPHNRVGYKYLAFLRYTDTVTCCTVHTQTEQRQVQTIHYFIF